MNKRSLLTHNLRRRPQQSRAGVTLVEVLMSLLVLGIGIASLAVMFPLSVLRTVEATQLTSATITRYNAEDLCSSFPALVFDPQPLGLDGVLGVAGTDDDKDIFNLPPVGTDPFGTDGQPGAANTDDDGDGVDDNIAETGWPGTDDPVYTENYLVDPLGWHLVPGANQNFMGSRVPRHPGALFTATSFPSPLAPMLNDWLNDENRAAGVVAGPDNYTTVIEDVGTYDTLTPTEFTLPGVGASDLTFPPPAGLLYRVVIFDPDKGISYTRPIADRAGDTLQWNEELPPDFTATAANAWFQVQDRRYSWMLTVHSDPFQTGPDRTARVEIVVFFKRSYSADDEVEYSVAESPFQVGVSSVVVEQTNAQPEPFLKNGGFVFDSQNAVWYRILTFENVTADIQNPAAGSTYYRLDLDRPAVKNSGTAMFMRGIVDIYPIKNKFVSQ